MKTKRIICITLTILIIFGASFNILSALTNKPNTEQKSSDKILNEIQTPDNKELKISSGKSLDYSDFTRNTTTVHKVFESIKFTVNVSKFDKANYTIMRMDFGQFGVVDINMTYVSSTNKNFTKTYTPKYNDPIGFIRVIFMIYNHSNVLLNTEEHTMTNFTIRANCALIPWDKHEYNLGELLSTQLVIANESRFYWIISVVDNINVSKEIVLFKYGNNKINIEFYVNESFSQENKGYYIKVNLTEKVGNRWDATYFNFTVKVPGSILDINTIKFNPTSMYRSESCILTLNVSAKDNNLIPSYVNVTLTLKDTNSYVIINNQYLTNDKDDSFRTTFSVPSNRPAGSYSYTIKTYYKLNQIEEYTSTILVKNNPPKIEGYQINGYDTEEHISVRYGETLEFEFDVSDVEESLSYVTVLLINEEGDEYEISREYDDDLIIEVRTEDLITGTWIVYVSVTDLDGATTELEDDFNDAPKEIEIIPDMLTSVLPWISLIIGIIVGIVSGIGMSYYLVKKQKLKFEPEETKEISKEKSLKIKKGKTVKPESTEKELEKEEIKKAEPKKEEPRKIRPPRKIKRKLR